jgi:electron transfer flavoprotein alpha subunit
MISVDKDRCTACGLCETACPFSAVQVLDNCAHITDGCTLCGTCATVCPAGAIAIRRNTISREALADYRGILIFVECLPDREGWQKPKTVVYELLSKGRELADKLHQPLMAVIMGNGRIPDPAHLGNYGADQVLTCTHPLLEPFSADGYCSVLSAVISEIKPSVLLYGATPNGRELAPRVAARLRLGLTADCTGLDIDDQAQLVQTRPAFGGNIMAAIVAPRSRPQTATVRPNVFPVTFFDPARKAEVREMAVTLNKAAIKTKIIKEVSLTETTGPDLENSRVILTVGRGCSQSSLLEKARKLAEKTGSTLACTRPLVEEGILPHTRQIGQSGITVNPDLYLGVGVSGAVQHLVGMGSSKTVIAINEDPKAPIFSIADLGVVADADQMMSALLSAIENR